MRILIDMTAVFDHLTGVERFAINIAENLIRQHGEHEYTLLFKNEVHPAFRGLLADGRFRCDVLKGTNKLLFNQWVLPRALGRHEADVYFFPAFCAPWLFRSGATVNTIHDMSDFECFEGKAFLKVLYSRLGILHAKRCSKRIVTVSEFSRGRIHDLLGIPEESIHVIYNGVSATFDAQTADDAPGWRERYGIAGGYLLSVCTIEPRKNLRLLIDTFRRMRPLDGIQLVLCGRMGWNPSASLGREDALEGVRITGFVDDRDLPALYRNARAFVFPSRYEGFGIPPVEAMRAGCPVISSDAASLPEVLGDAAIYFESGSSASLEQAIRRVLSMDAGEMDELKRRGMQRAMRYRWEDEAEKLHQVLLLAASCDDGRTEVEPR